MTVIEEQLKESIPSPLKLREMLEEMAVKELLGPVGGEEEEVSERIRDRYFVGILTPRKRAEESEDEGGYADHLCRSLKTA
jgi:hypothetical protein